MAKMKTAFEILGVPEQVDDDTIRRAYLQKVKQFPPEQAAEQFQKIRDSYEVLKDLRSRVKYQLFHQPEADFDNLLLRAFETDADTAINGESFIKLLQASVDAK